MSEEASRGRRDNGLRADEFTPAADVDPRVGEHLLDVLGLAGIAAYLLPSSDLHPITRTTFLPSRPTDRLWVDRRLIDQAQELIARLDAELLPDEPPATTEPDLPESPEFHSGSKTETQPHPAGGPASPPRRPLRRRTDLDVDTEWQQIVSGWDTAAPDTAAPDTARSGTTAPDATALDATAPDTARSDATALDATALDTTGRSPAGDPKEEASPGEIGASGGAGPSPVRHIPRPAPVEGLDTPFDPNHLVEDPDDDQGYTPPAPPPLPPISRYTVLAVALVAAGILLFFRPELLGVGENAALIVGLGGILAGFAILVWRLRDGLTEDDPDDGAVV
jgi:hypothetical protein